jgi:hypothetical protein
MQYVRPMTAGWNFERRRDTCAQFLMGVSTLTKNLPMVDTSLEAVRSRMALSSEESRFAARRLHEDQLIVFDGRAKICSNALGSVRAATIIRDVRAQTQNYSTLARTLEQGGSAAILLAAVLRAEGPFVCGAPEDATVTFRLALVDNTITMQHAQPDGTYVPYQPTNV